ncbi:MAG: alginate O-acetyltransferase AlgX-related protein [Chthoniobacterales bacterium]
MRRFSPFILLLVVGVIVASAAEVAFSSVQEAFRKELTNKVAALEKKNATAVAGKDGWLFLTSELRFLAQGVFWGDAAAKVSRAKKRDAADPIPAIVDFDRQLKARGIKLYVVPIPAKAAIYPDKIGGETQIEPTNTAPVLQQFYGELGRHDVDFIDLTATLSGHLTDPHGPMYCRTDTHWSGNGLFYAAQAIAEEVRQALPGEPPKLATLADWKEVSINGDLAALMPGAKIEPEKLWLFQLSHALQPDPNSPLLVIGDSHTLVFHDFLAERAGLLDQLTIALKYAPDLIGTRGSGATAVRVSLYRRAKEDPNYLAKKKVVLWCFAARELTESDQGWVVQPIAK